MISADRKKIPPPIAISAPTSTHRLVKACGSLLLGVLLAGCAAQSTVDDGKDTAAHAKADASAHSSSAPAVAQDTAPPVSLRRNRLERSWSGPPAAVEVNRGSVTPYPGEPESGEGVTAYGAGLRPPADRLATKPREDDEDDGDDGDSSISGVLIDRGLASWYGGQFHGRLTANGERFDRDEMTAAHRTLPFGSRLCVRNLSTGKTVKVRINDRGPFAPGRVIDLSQAAAQELGIQGLGLKQVELWKLHKGSDACPDELQTADSQGARSGKRVVSRMPVAEVSASATGAARKASERSTRKAKNQAPGKAVSNAAVNKAKASTKSTRKR
ncbi:septal ring lytic transglycosylase RlpA family protein [Diaphorobacter sp. HDW4A]|uniref:septal ring lytic transglycosylase RlpA family protein n=1 Tax=Diaphorobacter sp. HDW4A TaxID=2714924 RepID=UPI00140A2A16|nr:septal ring lytic transglycosylase RlpA family protein [Diaphorobacter sp. HDW4A]QIL81723.1 septal ring lytic transglycosylase RlpA family protein [Diaphorobacter sp. HDW4A]